MNDQRERSLFLAAARHAQTVFRPPDDAPVRPVRTKWLKGVALTAACVGIFALLVTPAHNTSPLEATARMEQLAKTLARVNTVDPATGQEIERLIRQPWYDCTQISCTAELEARNALARARLSTVLVQKTPEHDVKTADARQGPVADTPEPIVQIGSPEVVGSAAGR